jgi:hypothetical protein
VFSLLELLLVDHGSSFPDCELSRCVFILLVLKNDNDSCSEADEFVPYEEEIEVDVRLGESVLDVTQARSPSSICFPSLDEG